MLGEITRMVWRCNREKWMHGLGRRRGRLHTEAGDQSGTKERNIADLPSRLSGIQVVLHY